MLLFEELFYGLFKTVAEVHPCLASLRAVECMLDTHTGQIPVKHIRQRIQGIILSCSDEHELNLFLHLCCGFERTVPKIGINLIVLPVNLCRRKGSHIVELVRIAEC